MNRFLKAVYHVAMVLWGLWILACVLAGIWLLKGGPEFGRVLAGALFLLAALQVLHMLRILKK